MISFPGDLGRFLEVGLALGRDRRDDDRRGVEVERADRRLDAVCGSVAVRRFSSIVAIASSRSVP